MFSILRCIGLRAVLLTLCITGLTGTAVAADDPPRRTGIAWIDWAAEQASFVVEEAVPAETVMTTLPLPTTDGSKAATHSIETIEINRLREEIALLRAVIEQGVIGRVMILENEVRLMREALYRQQGSEYSGSLLQSGLLPSDPLAATPPVATPPTRRVPMPEDLMPTPSPRVEPSPEMLDQVEAFRFTVVEEWGRSPEVAADLGGDASTLIGIAGIVPARSAEEDVVALAQKLWLEYNDYDNISIEIFDTERAAQDYAATQSVDSTHHVASISRHKASNRDVILYLGSGKALPVPLPSE